MICVVTLIVVFINVYIFFLYAFFLWTGKSWKAPLSTSTRHYFWMGRTVTSRSAPWGRSGTCIKFTCVRLVQLSVSPNNRVLKTLVFALIECIFLSFAVWLFLQHVQVDPGRSLTWWLWTWEPRPEYWHRGWEF